MRKRVPVNENWLRELTSTPESLVQLVTIVDRLHLNLGGPREVGPKGSYSQLSPPNLLPTASVPAAGGQMPPLQER